MAFAQARAGDPHEARALLQIGDRRRAGIAHRRLHAADELVDHLTRRPLERHLPFDALRHQLELILDVALEITIRRSAPHRADRAHAAIRFVGAALIQERLARRFLGAGEQRSDHAGRCPGGKRLGDVARGADAAVGDHRHVRFGGFLGAVHHRRQLRHANAGDDAGGADRSGADAHLDAVRARIDQRARGLGGGNVAGDHLHRVGQLLHALHRAADLAIVAVRGIDDQQVEFGIDQRGSALESLVAHRRCGRDAKTPGGILGGVGVSNRLFDVLDGHQPDTAVIAIDHQQLFDPPLMEQPPRLFLADAGLHRRQIFVSHQLGDRLMGVFGKAHVAVRVDADQPPARLGHGDAADLVAIHQRLSIGQRRIRRDRDRIDHHAAFIPLDLANRVALFQHGHVAMKHADPAQLRHDDRHVGLGHRVHCGGKDRNVEGYAAAQSRADVRLAGKHVRFRRLQEHVVESKAEPDVHETPDPGCEGGFVAAHVTKASTAR